MAIGGLRDAAKSLRKLQASATFGRKLGLDIMTAITNDMLTQSRAGTPELSWVSCMCRKGGNDCAQAAPPVAVKTVRDIIVRHTGHFDGVTSDTDKHCTTDVDAGLLGSWRRASHDPDGAVPQ